MANVFLKADKILATALALLQREIILPKLVTRLGLADFEGAKDDSVTIRVPAILDAREYEWRTRGAAIVVDDVVEKSVTVALSKHPYSAVAVTDEQLTLDITSFAKQILAPQVRGVAEKLESYIAAALADAPITAAQTVTFTTATGSGYDTAIDVRTILNKNNVPMADRVLVLGADIEAAWLKDDKMSDVDKSGSSTALRDAILGRIGGFLTVVSNAIPPTVGYAFHKSAIVLGNVAPIVPEGVTAGASESSDGLAMRWIRDYDPNYLRDRSVVSSFAGTGSVNEGVGDDAAVVGVGTTDPINKRIVKIVSA